MSSRTPDGGYMPTFASNFMLDGFEFSEDYGEGSLTKPSATTSRTTGMAPAPSSQAGISKLPDGIVTADAPDEMGWDVFAGGPNSDVGDLSELVKTANHIVDLSWLEDVEQDPDRLPHHHNDAVLQGLVDAWGTRSRTDGVNLVPNIVVPPQPRSPVAQLPGDQYREIVASAMRKSAFGAPFENIVSEVAAHLGEAMTQVHTDPRLQKLAQSLRSVKAEHGVVGKVYLRDSAFPGLLTGKWDKAIKKKCADARYWLTKPGSKLAAYQNYLGKKVVTEIPWREALAHYRPTLEASGRKVAGGDPRRALLAALASEAPVKAVEAHHTYHVPPADRVTSKEAWEVFASAPPPVQEVVVRSEQGLSRDQAAQHLARWVRAGLLPVTMARKLMASGHKPNFIVEYGAWVIENPVLAGHETATYGGAGVGVKLLQQNTRNSEWARKESARIAAFSRSHKQRMARAKVAKVFDAWVKAGALTREVADGIQARNLPMGELIRLGSLAVNRAKKANYQGQGEGRTVYTGGPARAQAPARDPKVGQVLRYARVQMNNGLAGRDLDAKMVSRFSQEYLKGASEQLVQLRRKHEGLAGHLYVDASAYATPTGTNGCDMGASLHRASPIRSVLQMDRCGSCSQNSGGSCQKYKKILVAAAPVADPRRYQKDAIRLANADDSVRTAAMYDPGEFDLQNDSLDSFNFSNLPSGEVLSGVKFEGMLITEE